MLFFNPRPEAERVLRIYLHELRILVDDQKFEMVLTSQGCEPFPKEYPVLLDDFVIAKFYLKSSCNEHHEALAMLLSELVKELFETSWISHILESVDAPADLEFNRPHYYRRIAEQVGEATAARTVVLRLFSDTNEPYREKLVCEAIYDSKQKREKRSIYNIEKDRSKAFPIYQILTQAYEKDRETIFLFKKDHRSQDTHVGYQLFNIAKEYLDGVRLNTIVVLPLAVGGRVVGYLTLIYENNVSLTDPLKKAFSNMANHTAIAIENYSKIAEIRDLRDRKLKEALGQMHADLIHGLRHAARTHLHTAMINLQLAEHQYHPKSKSPDSSPLVNLKAALDSIDENFESMEKLRSAGETMVVDDIGRAFDEAQDILHDQLQSENIVVSKTIQGKLIISMNFELMRDAFANLLLNSIQAFKASHIGRDRRRVNLTGRRSGRDITLEYGDDGPGIRLGIGDIRELSDIWEPGKTSKDKGTGMGMAMVRQVFQQIHHGNIDLRDSTRGVKFRIRLQTDID